MKKNSPPTHNIESGQLMNDIERIRFIEETFGFKLNKVEFDRLKIDRKFFTIFIDFFTLSLLLNSDSFYTGTRNYCFDQSNNLTGLSLDFSPVFLLPEHFFSGLRYLKKLSLKKVYLKSYSFLVQLKELTSLDLRNNNLSDVSFLKELKGLTSLDLSYNNLSDVSFLKELKGLTNVNLSKNSIREIPKWLVAFILNIKIDSEWESNCINLYENPIEIPPVEIVRQGRDAMLNYFEQIEEQGGTEKLYEAKVIILGEAGAGKTTLFIKLQNPENIMDPII